MCYMYTPTIHTATPTQNKAHAELEANWTAGRRCDSVTAVETPTVVEDIARHQRHPKDLAPGGDEGIAVGEAGAAAFLHPLQPLHKALLAALQELQILAPSGKFVYALPCMFTQRLSIENSGILRRLKMTSPPMAILIPGPISVQRTRRPSDTQHARGKAPLAASAFSSGGL